MKVLGIYIATGQLRHSVPARKERAAFGEFMSKRKCLKEYDRLTPIIKGTT